MPENYAVIVENDISAWADETGVLYHFPKRYLELLKPNTRVIYYKGRIKVLHPFTFIVFLETLQRERLIGWQLTNRPIAAMRNRSKFWLGTATTSPMNSS